METSTRTQANVGQSSNPLVIREGHQDGGQLRSSTIISNQYVLIVPVLPQTQGGQPSNQQSSSRQVTPSQPASEADFSRGQSLLDNSDSQTACVYAQNGNLPQPEKGKFENLSLLQSYKEQSKDSQVSSQNSPTAIITQQGRQEMASCGIPQQAVLIQQASNRMILPRPLQYSGTSNYLFCSDSVQSAQTSSPSSHVLVTRLNTSVGLQRMTIKNGVLHMNVHDKMVPSDQTGTQALQHGSNQVLSSCIGLYNTNSLNALISQTGAFVANHSVQSPPSDPAPPPYPVRQGFNAAVTKDQSGNGFMVGNVIFMGGKPNENILVLQGQQQQGPSVSNGSQLEQINMSHLLVHQVPQNDIRVHPSAAPVSSTRHRQKAIAVVQPLSQAQQVMTTDTLSIRKPVELLLTNTTTDTEAVGNPGRISHETKSQAGAEGLQSTSLLAESKQGDPHIGLGSTPAAKAEGALTLDSSAPIDTGQSPEQLYAEQDHSQVFPSVNHQPTLTPTQGKDTEYDTVVNQVPVNHSSKETMETKGPVTLSEDTVELCSVPVVEWTNRKLMALLKWGQYFIHNGDCAETDVTNTILAHYWDGSYKKMVDMATSGYYKNVMAEVVEVCREYALPQSVIFSYVRDEHLSRLKDKCHVLGHNTVYPKIVHKSSWLNTNEQLDDIDKEYGLPWCLKNSQHTHSQREEQLELMGTEDDRSEAASEMQEMMPQSKTVSPGPEPDVASEIKESCLTHSCTQRDIPVKMERAEDDGSGDPFYSMKIHVLAPEEAKYLCLFEDVQVQGEESADQQRGATLCSVGDELPEEMDVVLTEAKSENKVEDLMEKYCCLSSLMAKLRGMNCAIPCPCQCKSELTPGTPTFKDDSFGEENSVERNFLAVPKVQDRSVVECGREVKSNVNPMKVNVGSKTFGRKRNQCVEGSYLQLPVPKKYKIKRCLQSTLQPAVHNWSVNCNKSFGEHNTSDEDIEVIKSKATESFEEEQPQASTTQRLTGYDHVTSSLTVSVVQLALFGSSPQRKYGTVTTGKSRGKRTNPFTDRAPTPPPTINVNVSSWMRKGSSVGNLVMKSPEVKSPKAKSAVKERLLKDWKDNFVPTKTTKSKRDGCPEVRKKYVVNATSTKMDGILSAVPEDPAGSEQTRSKKESILNGLKLRLKKAKISPPEKSKYEIGNPDFSPSQDSSALSFSVLPKSFDFREQEHTDRDTTTGSKADMGDDAVSWKYKSSRTTIQKPKVAWSTDSEKKYSPLPCTKPNPPKSTNAFKEYQMKYTENMEHMEYQKKYTENIMT